MAKLHTASPESLDSYISTPPRPHTPPPLPRSPTPRDYYTNSLGPKFVQFVTTRRFVKTVGGLGGERVTDVGYFPSHENVRFFYDTVPMVSIRSYPLSSVMLQNPLYF